LKEKVTPYLKNLSTDPQIKLQYYISEYESQYDNGSYDDPLMEDKHEAVKGLVHKYDNRALIKVSYQCAAHCRFCTRIRQIGNPEGTLNEQDIGNIIQYLKNNSQIEDVILSGGDPFYTPKLTMQLLQQLQMVESVKIIRIGTRMPLQSPNSFYTKTLEQLLEVIDEIGKRKPFYILLHVEHPSELTEEALDVITLLRNRRVTLLSQSVFLKGINDSFETLHELFTKLYFAGVVPYYLYHCDKVNGLQHFEVDSEKEIEIATRLHKELSGIACPTYIVDIKNGYGKIPVSLNFVNSETIFS